MENKTHHFLTAHVHIKYSIYQDRFKVNAGRASSSNKGLLLAGATLPFEPPMLAFKSQRLPLIGPFAYFALQHAFSIYTERIL